MEPVAMAALTSSELGFPLFSYETKLGDPSDGRYLCLYRTINDDHLQGTFCGQYKYTFDHIIKHLEDHHFLKLTPRVDFCSDCNVLHESKLDAMAHAYEHILMFEDNNVTCEPHHKETLSLWLQPFFVTAQEERKKLLNRIFFDDMVELEELPDLDI